VPSPTREPDPHAPAARREASRPPASAREAVPQRIAAAVARGNALLVRSLDPQAVMLSALEVAVPALAEWGVLQAPGEAGEPDRCQVLHADEASLDLVGRLARFPFARAGALREAGGARQVAWPSGLPPGLGSPDEVDALSELHPRSLVVLPLYAGRSACGTLALGSSENGRALGPDEAPLLSVLGDQVGLALHAAGVYERAERARAAAEARMAALAHDLKNHLHIAGLALVLLGAPDLADDRRQAQLDALERALRLMSERISGAPDGRPPG
jgi:GAF domain-containing protein